MSLGPSYSILTLVPAFIDLLTVMNGSNTPSHLSLPSTFTTRERS
jgi:hypothetical protein